MPDRPQTTLTFAQSIDGRIATSSGDSRWISGSETLTLAHEIRRDSDAVLVGIGTVLADDPQLTCRLPGCASPLRVILDTNLRLPPSSHIAQSAAQYPTLAYTAVDIRSASHLSNLGVQLCRVPERTVGGGMDLHTVLEDLWDRGIESLMVEGGSSVITSFFRSRLVDRLIVVTAPVVIGEGIPSVGDLGVGPLSEALRGRTVEVRQMGQDVVWEVRFGGGTH